MKTTRIFAAILVTALAMSCKSNNGVKVDGELPSSAEVDSVSYLIGVNFGSFLKGNSFCGDLSELNMSQIKKGMQDFLKAEGNMYSPEFGEQFKINPDQMGRILNGYLGKKNEYKAAYNKAAGEKFLAENLAKGEVDTTATGLQYIIHEEGEGARVQPTDTVWVYYSGKTIDGNEFDGNMGAEEPTRFVAKEAGFTDMKPAVGRCTSHPDGVDFERTKQVSGFRIGVFDKSTQTGEQILGGMTPNGAE